MRDFREIEQIVIHGTGHKPEESFDMEELAKDHYRRGIRPNVPESRSGFHFVIDRDGIIHTGRQLHEGARLCNHLNKSSIAVALVGGVTEEGNWGDQYALLQFISLLAVIGDTMQQVDPFLEVVGLNEITGCPRALVGRPRNPGFTPSSWWMGALSALAYGRGTEGGTKSDTERTSVEPPERERVDHAD